MHTQISQTERVLFKGLPEKLILETILNRNYNDDLADLMEK
jgi:hypothetical protein